MIYNQKLEILHLTRENYSKQSQRIPSRKIKNYRTIKTTRKNKAKENDLYTFYRFNSK